MNWSVQRRTGGSNFCSSLCWHCLNHTCQSHCLHFLLTWDFKLLYSVPHLHFFPTYSAADPTPSKQKRHRSRDRIKAKSDSKKAARSKQKNKDYKTNHCSIQINTSKLKAMKITKNPFKYVLNVFIHTKKAPSNRPGKYPSQTGELQVLTAVSLSL